MVLTPNDEGLYYNIALAYIGKSAWHEAAETMSKALKINSHFLVEVIKLMTYIRATRRMSK